MIYSYPSSNANTNRAWVRFKQVDYKLESDNSSVSEKGRDSVYLYLPAAVQVSDGATYADAELGFGGRIVEEAIRQGGIGEANTDDIGNRMSSVLQFGAQGLRQAATVATEFAGGESVNAALITKVLQGFNMENNKIGSAIQSGVRMTANPHVRAIFKQVGLREFSFEFEMIPDNAEEAKHVEQIIKFFRSNLYPELAEVPTDLDTDDEELNGLREVAATINDAVYNFPSMLHVDMFYEMENVTSREIDAANLEEENFLDIDGSNNTVVRVGPKLLPCYIKSVSTTYDPGSAMAFRPDGRPVGYKIAITIQEDRTLDKKKILSEGY